MPIYVYWCSKCQKEVEVLQGMNDESPYCPECGQKMEQKMTFPAMVKIRGFGGYPSRRKMVNDTAPYSKG